MKPFLRDQDPLRSIEPQRFDDFIVLTILIIFEIVSDMGKRPLGGNFLPKPLHRGTLSQTTPRSPGPIGLGHSRAAQSSGGGGALAASPPALGRQVVNFARERLGQQVGDGECFALADQGLRSAGAASAGDFGSVGPDTNYRWSSQTVSPADAQPGDIIQFRDFAIETRTDNADGSWRSSSETRPHHTAVVMSNDGSGNLIIIEQNVQIGGSNGQARRTVRQNQIPTASHSRRSGTSTITIRVSGTMVVYRPVPRSSPSHQPPAHDRGPH